MKKIIFLLIISALFSLIKTAEAQKVGFIDSESIRANFLEAKQADQRIQSMVEEWKRELQALQTQIEALEFEIEKNRLVWSDFERAQKEKELDDLKKRRIEFAKAKFEEGGEYDDAVNTIMAPIEEKIYASVQEVAAENGFDMVWDIAKQPLPYVNFKFDLTVKVLRKLGVDVKKLEEELREKIKKDPRNKKKKSYKPRRRSRSRSAPRRSPDQQEERQEENKEQEKIEKRQRPPEENPREIERIENEKK